MLTLIDKENVNLILSVEKPGVAQSIPSSSPVEEDFEKKGDIKN